MGLVDALKAGNFSYFQNTSGNVNITTGNGNNNINVSGGNININTGNGNQTINATAFNNLNIETGDWGIDKIDATANHANIVTNDSNDTIKFEGNSFDISSLGGDNIVYAQANIHDDKKENSIALGTGNDTVIAVANNLTLDDEGGRLHSSTLGDNMNLTANDGNHTINFWGDNNTIQVGDGNHKIQTMDHTVREVDMSTLKILDDMGVIDALEQRTSEIRTKISESAPIVEGSNGIDAIAKKFGLSAAETAILKSVDLTAKYSDGKSLYVIVRSPQKSAAAGQDVYVIAKRDGNTHMRAVSNNECIAVNGWKSESAQFAQKTSKDVVYDVQYLVNGVTNTNITTGDGRQVVDITTRVDEPSNTTNVNVGDNKTGLDNIINIYNGYLTDAVRETVREVVSENKGILSMLTNTGASGTKPPTWNSPLVVDFNRDGQVSAQSGIGVDIDNNGKADGAATGGDKMLAMSDMNNNGKVDGQEVFGDQTVSPFTGKKLNAANGFEALKIIAQEAKLYAGVDCMKDGNVDLQTLKDALATVGVNLGFVSDENTTKLEDLAHVAYINVENYTEHEQTGDVQHRQQGSYIDTSGATHKVNDVWFTLQ